jgi:ketosteroid isomerase-like protein
MADDTQAIDLNKLPRTITGYLTAHRDRDADAAITYFTDDAAVVDDGRTYQGPAEIHTWLDRSSSEYTYTIELVDAEKIDDEHYTAINHLEGDFPGGVVDLHFRFTLRDGHIARLAIEA